MEFNKTIAARQSVRKFTEAQITDEQLKQFWRQPMQHRPAWDSMIICI